MQQLSSFEQACLEVITHKQLSSAQKARQLSLLAENNLPYVPLSKGTRRALDERVICDMYEGHTPYKPRYVLPDYARYLSQGSTWLELTAAQNFDDALNMLTILYHHVPSVTAMPVFLGTLDEILMPYVNHESEEYLYQKLKHFWIMLDRTIPDAFMHANIGPSDNIICRLILKIDRELKQVAPNLTFFYDPNQTPDELLAIAISNICETSKPHIANYPMMQKDFDEKGFGVVSCYNSLPIAGGGSTLSRINLKEVAIRANDIDDFFNATLPYYCEKQTELIEARTEFLYEKSNFFESSFLVEEGLIEPNRFAPMFGVYGMAEAVDLLMQKSNLPSRYGIDKAASELANRISHHLSNYVLSTPVKYGWNGSMMLHAQSGISLDIDVTPGARLPYGKEPDPVTHILNVAQNHIYYTSGISDILTIDETIRTNPLALKQLCTAAFTSGMREFTANIEGHDLVRVTGYMVRLSDIKQFREKGSRLNTTCLGEEAANASQDASYLHRKPRVVSHEHFMGTN